MVRTVLALKLEHWTHREWSEILGFAVNILHKMWVLFTGYELIKATYRQSREALSVVIKPNAQTSLSTLTMLK